MFVKLAVFVCFAGSALAQYQGPLAGGQPASLYPAGVSPQSCPNYPDCSNPLVAIGQDAAPQYARQAQQQYPQQRQYQQPQPQYQPSAPISQYNPVYPQQYAPSSSQTQYAPEVQQRLDRGEYIGDGDYHGEGLAEALAPGFAGQQRQHPAPQYQQEARAYQPQQQFDDAPSYSAHAQPAQVPAGVNAQACPNYPFCHA